MLPHRTTIVSTGQVVGLLGSIDIGFVGAPSAVGGVVTIHVTALFCDTPRTATQNAPAVLVSHTKSPSHVSRSVALRSNNASVFVRTSVKGRPARRVVWLTGKS
jgi:hypothetical protein